MLTYPGRQIVLSPVRTDSDDAFPAVGLLAFLEKNINSILWDPCQILAPEPRKAREHIVKVLASLSHATWRSNHCSCLPKASPCIGTV